MKVLTASQLPIILIKSHGELHWCENPKEYRADRCRPIQGVDILGTKVPSPSCSLPAHLPHPLSLLSNIWLRSCKFSFLTLSALLTPPSSPSYTAHVRLDLRMEGRLPARISNFKQQLTCTLETTADFVHCQGKKEVLKAQMERLDSNRNLLPSHSPNKPTAQPAWDPVSQTHGNMWKQMRWSEEVSKGGPTLRKRKHSRVFYSTTENCMAPKRLHQIPETEGMWEISQSLLSNIPDRKTKANKQKK